MEALTKLFIGDKKLFKIRLLSDENPIHHLRLDMDRTTFKDEAGDGRPRKKWENENGLLKGLKKK